MGDVISTGADGSYVSATGDCYLTLGTVDHLPNIPSGMVDSAVNQALLSLLGQGSVNLGEDVGQYQQTIGMVTDKVHSVRRSISRFKRANPKAWQSLRARGFRAGRRVTNLWLEYEYGWKPLLQDVYGGLKQLDELGHEPGQPRKRTVVDRRETTTLKQSIPGDLSPSTGSFWADAQITDRIGIKVRIDFSVTNSVAHHLAATGLVNPIDIVWELVPYSFVVDWFLPVGNYLQAWTAGLGLTFSGGSISSFRERRIQISNYRPGQIRQRVNVSGFSYRNMAMSRAITGWEVPRIPHLKNPLSLTHFANAMSLLVGVFTDDGRVRPLV